MNARVSALVLGFLALSQAGVARAEPMDPALERLVLDRACHGDDGNDATPFGVYTPQSLDDYCRPDHEAFTKLINAYGFAFAPTSMHSARTTGFGGFNLALEAAYTKVDDSSDYLRYGTQGPTDPTSKTASTRNDSPQPLLQLYSVKVRKGFAFGLEITGSVGFMPKTSIVSGGADVRLALLEGFRTGLPGVLPDVAVGGGVRTITGTPQFQLTVSSLDVQVSKPIPIQDSSILTPWVGYQYVWIFGDSGLIDLTPGTDAVQYCNYRGNNQPGTAEPNRQGTSGENVYVYDGQPICDGGSPLDFNNNSVFRRARLERQRLLFGLNYRYEMVTLGGQFIMDMLAPDEAQTSDEDAEVLKDEHKQWTMVFELGTMF
jgi:hypothetical protein